MRILHTSDWHLGKSLEGCSRLDEQEKFLEDFIKIVDENNIDLVMIAGDIYDSGNPPARAERLFYKTLKRISNGGERAVLVIAGNHDNPERLVAASPLAYDHGVILLGTPKSFAETGEYGGFRIVDSGEGYIEIEIKNERAVIITLPYPSEKRLNEILSEDMSEEERKKSYSIRVGEIFERLSEKYREDTINIAVSHIFITGGESSGSERPIELGGSLAVDESSLPRKAQYIALGHLHRPQRISRELNAYYSGSPIKYSKSEADHKKCVYIVNAAPGKDVEVEKVCITDYKPIEVFKCKSIEEAIEVCRENKDRKVWAYFEIETDRVIMGSEIKEMKELMPDIIEIRPIPKGTLKEDDEEEMDIRNKSMVELFKEFYKSKRDMEITDELLELFMEITKEEGGEDETKDAEDIGA